MILELLVIIFGLLALVNLWVTWRVIKDDLSSPSQRVAQFLLIWMLPFLGALLVLRLQRRQPGAHSGHYREAPNPGEDYGASGMSHRKTQQVLEGDTVDSGAS